MDIRKLGAGLERGGSGGMPPNRGHVLRRLSTILQLCGDSSSKASGDRGALVSAKHASGMTVNSTCVHGPGSAMVQGCGSDDAAAARLPVFDDVHTCINARR